MNQKTLVKRVILHAGLPKTATTSIQNAVFSQRAALMKQHGILYPGAEPNHTNALCTAFMEDPRKHISHKVAGRTDLKALLSHAQDIRGTLEQEITAAAPETVLFSAEGMSNLNATELGKFRDWVATFAQTLEVFYILRNPLNYVVSVTQQHLKGGEVLEDMYEALPLPNFKGRLSAAITAFGKDHVSVHIFEDMCTQEDGIVGAFLDRIGLLKNKADAKNTARQNILATQKRDNESLSHEAAMVLSSLNRQRPAFIEGQLGPRRAMNELGAIEMIRGDKFRLPPEIVTRVLDQSRDDITWVRETLGVTAYDNIILPEAERETLHPATIDSLAVILSNLLNDRQVNSLISRARVLHSQGQTAELKGLAQSIARIAPDRQLPDFLVRAINRAPLH